MLCTYHRTIYIFEDVKKYVAILMHKPEVIFIETH